MAVPVSCCRVTGSTAAFVAVLVAVLLATWPPYEPPSLYNPHCGDARDPTDAGSGGHWATSTLSPVPFRLDCPPPVGATRLPYFTQEGGAGVTVSPWVAAAPPVTIAAPVSEVWAALVDVGAYGSWNPFTPHVTVPRVELGAPVTLCVLFSNRTERVHVAEGQQVPCDTVQVEYISLLMPPAPESPVAAIAWHQAPFGTPLLLQAERVQVVERVGGPESSVSR